MSENANTLNETSRLILHRTPHEDIQNGVTIMVKGEGARVVDKEGKSYLDMVAGITRPVHVGYGRIVARAKQLGVLFKTMGFALEFAPPLIITKEDIDESIAVLERCISEEEKDMGLS